MKKSNLILLIGLGVVMVMMIFLLIKIGALLNKETIKGEGDISEKQFEVEAFENIQILGSFNVEFTQGTTRDVLLLAEDNLHQYISVLVDDNTLKIKTTDPLKPNETMKVNITNDQLKRLEVSGDGIFANTGNLELSYLRILANAASNVTIRGFFDELITQQNAASTVVLEGTTRILDIESNAAGRVDASGMQAGRAKVVANAGTNVDVKADTLSATATSASRIRYLGNPVISALEANSAGSVRQVN